MAVGAARPVETSGRIARRLTQLAPGGSPVTLQTDYSYDAVGNRTTRNVGGALETLAYDAFSNRLDTVTAGGVTRTLGYSDSGNTDSDDNGLGTVLTKLYDATDRLAEVKNGAATVAAYLHNAQGQRVAKTVGAAVTHYIYDLGGNLIAEADGGTGAASAEYVALEGKPLAYIATAAIYWVHGDHLGTPQMLTDAAGAAVWDANYRPFGEATVTGALAFNLRFPGQYEDAETGLHYNYFRDYDPATGRYIQSDPIGLYGGWNTYTYVGGNPLTKLDFWGLLEVYVWDSTDSTWGHASMMLDDGTYISWWPGATNDNSLFNWGQIYCADAIIPRSKGDDIRDEGGRPDHTINIEGLDEAAISDWWDEYKKDGNWCSVDRNCSSTVADALGAGGGGLSAAPWSGWAVGAWTPSDVLDYARALE